jgi:hypothetical protein
MKKAYYFVLYATFIVVIIVLKGDIASGNQNSATRIDTNQMYHVMELQPFYVQTIKAYTYEMILSQDEEVIFSYRGRINTVLQWLDSGANLVRDYKDSEDADSLMEDYTSLRTHIVYQLNRLNNSAFTYEEKMTLYNEKLKDPIEEFTKVVDDLNAL